MVQEINIQNLQKSDLQAVAAIHLAAFSDSALTALGMESTRRYYEWQLIGPHQITALGAFQQHKLRGFCFAGIFRGAMSGFLRQNRTYLAWRVLTHPWLMGNPIFRKRLSSAVRILKRHTKLKTASSIKKNPKPESFGILSIAVHPQCQGIGAGKLLMKKVEAIAIQQGFRQMHLTVHIDNEQAICFYEKLGWKRWVENGRWNGNMYKLIGL